MTLAASAGRRSLKREFRDTGGDTMTSRVFAGGLVLVGVAFAASLAWAAQEHIDAFRTECEAQNDPSLPCECFANEATVRLNDNQQAYLYAQSVANQAEIDRLEDLMSADEISGTESYMRNIADFCSPLE